VDDDPAARIAAISTPTCLWNIALVTSSRRRTSAA
jgi:hypothetical protein